MREEETANISYKKNELENLMLKELKILKNHWKPGRKEKQSRSAILHQP